MFKELFTIALRMSRALGNAAGYELKVILTDHEIKLDFANPDDEENCWDEEHYVKGNVFLQGYANPIKPQVSEGEDNYDLIESKRYRTYMKNSLVDDIMRASKDKTVSLGQAVIALGALQILTLGAIFIV